MRSPTPYITCKDITINIDGKVFFDHSDWIIHKGEQWAMMGSVGAGKSILAQALANEIPVENGSIHYALDVSEVMYLSFSATQEDSTSELDCKDLLPPYTKNKYIEELMQILKVEPLLDKSMNSLTPLEMRTCMIFKSLLKKPKILMLDEPFDSLDSVSLRKMKKIVTNVCQLTQIILITHNLTEILASCTHVALIKNGRILAQGAKQEVLNSEQISALYGVEIGIKQHGTTYDIDYHQNSEKYALSDLIEPYTTIDEDTSIVEMKNITIVDGKKTILDHCTWQMTASEQWALIDDNDRSTVLELIYGTNFPTHMKKIQLFGKSRDTQTSDELRRKIGVLSSHIDLYFEDDTKCFTVLASGYFDTVGLYRPLTKEQSDTVLKLASALKINALLAETYGSLSHGQKQILLLARAVIKSPRLLILDEPIQNLGIPDSKRMLDIINSIGNSGINLIYRTHHLDEIPRCITHILELQKGKVIYKGPR